MPVDSPGAESAGRLGRCVAVVGSLNVDLVFRVAVAPRAGETVDGAGYAETLGGKGANQAVAARRAGADVVLIAAVGDDDAGAMAVRWLGRTGVTDAHLVTVPGAATGRAVIVVEATGENRIVVANGANGLLRVEDVLAELDGADDVGSVVISAEIPAAACRAAGAWAFERGIPAVYNAAPARALDDDLLAAHPLLAMNEGEAAQLTGEGDPAAAASALGRRSGRPVVVTLGADGALVAEGRDVTRFPAVPVEAHDTTGAGDAFCGTLAAEIAAGVSLPDAVTAANLAAARLVAEGRP